MPTNRRRRTRAYRALTAHDHLVLMLGSGMNHWTGADRAHYRELWRIHGHRLIEEARANGSRFPLAHGEFGDPR